MMPSNRTNDEAHQLVLAEHCGVSPLVVGKRLWYDNDPEQLARKVEQVMDRYRQQIPNDPLVEQYKQDNPARNQAHYFLTNSSSYNALCRVLNDQIFYPKYKETEERMQNLLKERLGRKRYSAIMLGDNIFIDPKEVRNANILNAHFIHRLREAYDRSVEDPWEYAVAPTAEDCIAHVKTKPLSKLPSDEFRIVLRAYPERNK